MRVGPPSPVGRGTGFRNGLTQADRPVCQGTNQRALSPLVPAGADPGRREPSAGYACRDRRTTTADVGSNPTASIKDQSFSTFQIQTPRPAQPAGAALSPIPPPSPWLRRHA